MKIPTVFGMACAALMIESALAPVMLHWVSPTNIALSGALYVILYIEFRFGRPMDAGLKAAADLTKERGH